ncbi:hypothetical protein BHE74_00019333 [Ensete ventricosum]|nr:hypothetical protein GW17_00031195 [Ensete ventricosum]RWW72836.1 hypothetical protein BHE74_00019333 [Ensete ventricosum]
MMRPAMDSAQDFASVTFTTQSLSSATPPPSKNPGSERKFLGVYVVRADARARTSKWSGLRAMGCVSEITPFADRICPKSY